MRGKLFCIGSSISCDKYLKHLFLSITYVASSPHSASSQKLRGIGLAVAAFQRTPHPQRRPRIAARSKKVERVANNFPGQLESTEGHLHLQKSFEERNFND
jgi:hypothetical protein